MPDNAHKSSSVTYNQPFRVSPTHKSETPCFTSSLNDQSILRSLISTLRRRVICRQRGGSINRPYIIFTLAKIRPHCCGKQSIGTATHYSARRQSTRTYIHSYQEPLKPTTSSSLGGCSHEFLTRASRFFRIHTLHTPSISFDILPQPPLPQPTIAANQPPGRPETIYKPLPTNLFAQLELSQAKEQARSWGRSSPKGASKSRFIQVGPLTGEVLVPVFSVTPQPRHTVYYIHLQGRLTPF